MIQAKEADLMGRLRKRQSSTWAYPDARNVPQHVAIIMTAMAAGKQRLLPRVADTSVGSKPCGTSGACRRESVLRSSFQHENWRRRNEE